MEIEFCETNLILQRLNLLPLLKPESGPPPLVSIFEPASVSRSGRVAQLC
jgi:hypothetical protein